MTSSTGSGQESPRGSRRKSLTKGVLVAIGIVSVVLGTAGIFIPLLPTTPFLLLAGACFTRSSDRLYNWLIHHRWFGTYIRNYREHRAITLTTKVLAIALLWSTMAYTNLVVVQSWALRVPLLAVTVGVTVHLLMLRTFRPGQDLGCDPNPKGRAAEAGPEEQDVCAEAEGA